MVAASVGRGHEGRGYERLRLHSLGWISSQTLRGGEGIRFSPPAGCAEETGGRFIAARLSSRGLSPRGGWAVRESCSSPRKDAWSQASVGRGHEGRGYERLRLHSLGSISSHTLRGGEGIRFSPPAGCAEETGGRFIAARLSSRGLSPRGGRAVRESCSSPRKDAWSQASVGRGHEGRGYERLRLHSLGSISSQTLRAPPARRLVLPNPVPRHGPPVYSQTRSIWFGPSQV